MENEKKINYKDFDLSGRILLLGEGSFDFSKKLVEILSIILKDRFDAKKIIATEIRDENNILEFYPEAKNNLDYLRKMGIEVSFGIDALKLDCIYKDFLIETIIWVNFQIKDYLFNLLEECAVLSSPFYFVFINCQILSLCK